MARHQDPRHCAAATGRAKALKVTRTRAGTVLASSRGLTLYYYSADKPHSGKSACTGVCATAWPPLAAPVKAPAGARLPGRLGVITRPNGVKQVTLNGHPLYFYAGDKAPGQAKGNGIEGSWHVIKIKARLTCRPGQPAYGWLSWARSSVSSRSMALRKAACSLGASLSSTRASGPAAPSSQSCTRTR